MKHPIKKNTILIKNDNIIPRNLIVKDLPNSFDRFKEEVVSIKGDPYVYKKSWDGKVFAKKRGDSDYKEIVKSAKQVIDYMNNNSANIPKSTKLELKNFNNPTKDFGIIDKDVDSIYYFNKNKKLIHKEPVITGSDKSTRTSNAYSMAEYFKKYNTDDHQKYFDYLKSINQRITPSGNYIIGESRDNVDINPSFKGYKGGINKALSYISGNVSNMLQNGIFSELVNRPEEIRKSRLIDYGSQKKLLTLVNSHGLGMPNAIHGTDNPGREKALSQKVNVKDSRKLSNGCINVGDKSCAFNLLGKGSNVIITGEGDQSKNSYNQIEHVKINPITSAYKKAKRDVYNDLVSKNIKPDNEALSFIASVAQKETSNMTNPLAKLESALPYSIAHSQGKYEINPDSFKEYLPADYDDSDSKQTEAVYNFYNKNKSKVPLSKMYALYNSGNPNYKSGSVDKFNKINKLMTDL